MAVISQADLERRFGATNLARWLDDDGDNIADPELVEEYLEEASQIAEDILAPAFPDNAQRAAMFAESRSLRGYVASIAIGLMGPRKPEFVGPNGESLLAPYVQRGEERLREIAAGKLRVEAEETSGDNVIVESYSSAPADHAFIFGASRANPRGPGSF